MGGESHTKLSNTVSQVLARPSEWLELFKASRQRDAFFLFLSAHNKVCGISKTPLCVQQRLQVSREVVEQLTEWANNASPFLLLVSVDNTCRLAADYQDQLTHLNDIHSREGIAQPPSGELLTACVWTD
ncbi:hypothetical protein BCh11DRAFT_07197 [Burkholderia sp. Ch1-1]|uniref:Uncharacterized protein n=1 Tax=Paraburkholderia dioscoreae TaxID=2604047 RepID=A0A5Q4YV38_9BURK|nr:hypothetical protein BCh11DRAFT_07197 [Burkholderia sp. Ch1-1]VVD28052.1 conserved protein of unknown function [Paraburkholderia dioscoreae]